MLSDEWLPRYRLLENFTAKWNGNGNGNGNAYDRGDYNSSFALRAVELKIVKKNFFQNFTKYFSHHPLSADTSFKFLSLILFQIWHLQNFISIFSKGRNFTRGDNSPPPQKKIRVCYFSMRNPYMKFQDDISFRNIIDAKFQGPKF